MWQFLKEYQPKAEVNNELVLYPIIEEGQPLLLAHITKVNGTHIAISLDIPTLMSTLTTQRSGFQPVVLDSNNTIAHPMNAQLGTDWIQVPGPRLFPQYHVALVTFPQTTYIFRLSSQ